MEKYFLILLNKDTVTSQDSRKEAQIQENRLNYMNDMAEAGKFTIAGPIGEDGELRGILILNVPS